MFPTAKILFFFAITKKLLKVKFAIEKLILFILIWEVIGGSDSTGGETEAMEVTVTHLRLAAMMKTWKSMFLVPRLPLLPLMGKSMTNW